MDDDRSRPPGADDAEDDPFAFPQDDAPPPSPADEDRGSQPAGGDPPSAPAGGPSARRGRRGTRRAPVPSPEEDERAALRRTTAEQAAAHARSVGARWLAGAVVVFLILVVVTTISGGPDRDGGDVQPGERLPEFAAPLVDRPKLDADDVNLATRNGQGEAGNTAACAIRDPSVVTSCALLARGPLVVVVFSRGVGSCVEAVDAVDAERRRYPGLQALAVSLLGRHDTTGETARDRRWTLPVVYDRDGALGSVLGVPACPLVLFVRRDGTVQNRIIGSLDRADLADGMRRLVATTPPSGSVDATPPGR